VADVFISYASQDRERAEQLAAALAPRGWSVWWDRRIVAGQAYDQAIERELEAARSVVVLWSAHSITSEWVKNEAAVASERGVLVPARIEDVKLPLEFRRRQAANLVGWNGEGTHRGFEALCQGVAAVIAGPAREAPAVQGRPALDAEVEMGARRASARADGSTPGANEPRAARRRPLVIVSIVLAIGVGIGVYAMGPWHTVTAPLPAMTAPSGTQTSPGGAARPSANSRAADASGPADLVVGTYVGDVIADSLGSSRSDVLVTIAKVDKWTVRVTSDYARLGAVDVALTRIGDKIMSAGGDATLVLDLERAPPILDYNPQGIAYRGKRRG
jgi:TIR domain-containing protein